MIDTHPHGKKQALLAAFAQSGTIKQAAEAAGVDRTMHYHWLKQDPEYATAWERAKKAFIENLENEARRRAVDGWEEPVFHQGEMCGTRRKFSDTLLIPDEGYVP